MPSGLLPDQVLQLFMDPQYLQLLMDPQYLQLLMDPQYLQLLMDPQYGFCFSAFHGATSQEICTVYMSQGSIGLFLMAIRANPQRT